MVKGEKLNANQAQVSEPRRTCGKPFSHLGRCSKLHPGFRSGAIGSLIFLNSCSRPLLQRPWQQRIRLGPLAESSIPERLPGIGGCIAHLYTFRLFSKFPNASVNPQLQTEPSTIPPTVASSVRPSTMLRSAVPLWQWGVLAILSVWLYWSTLAHLVVQWWTDPNFSHGFFVPLFSGVVIWQERDRLARIAPQPSWAGLGIVLAGLVVLVVGRLGAELFLDRSSLLLLLAGIVILFFGWNLFRAVLFPWAFLLLMIPIPTIVFNQITFPLQLLASKVAATVLPFLGVPILREGNVINLPSMALEVAEACSGIRSLMSLVTLAIIYGYLMEKRLWVRWLLAFASVPIAVAANSIRIIGTGLLVQYWDADKAEGYFHASWGWIIFVVSFMMLYALHALTRLVFPEKGGSPS